jgi:hypothetical protein
MKKYHKGAFKVGYGKLNKKRQKEMIERQLRGE